MAVFQYCSWGIDCLIFETLGKTHWLMLNFCNAGGPAISGIFGFLGLFFF